MAHRKKHHRHRPRFLRNRAVRALFYTLVLAAGVYLLAGFFEPPEQETARVDLPEEKSIQLGETTIVCRDRVSTFLFLGTDRREEEAASGFYTRNDGQADFIMLLVEDDENRRITPVIIDRDTMTEISVTNIMGKIAGTRTAQLCLSYAFGADDPESCELTSEAVSRLLGGLSIDHYMELNMNDVGTLNDAAGGVTVLVQDDLSSLDPALVPGSEVTLQGDQAQVFVRARQGVGAGTNEERMGRQKTYLEAFFRRVREGIDGEGEEYLDAFLQAIDKVMVKDISKDTLLDHLWKRQDYTWEAPRIVTGTYRIGADGFMEFYPDGNNLINLLTELFGG